MKRAMLMLAICAVPSLAHAYYDTFLGFSTDGAFYVTRLEPGGLAFALCRTQATVTPASWPAGAPAPEPGKRCAQLCHPGACKDKIENARVKPWLAEAKASRPGERGETWSLDQKGESVTVSMSLAGKKLVVLVQLINPAPAKVGDVFWRADEGAVAFYLDPVLSVDGGSEPTDRSVVVGTLPVVTGRAAASMALGRAQRAWLAGDFGVAANELRQAIKFDPTYTNAHYGLAVASALMHDTAAAHAELEWLARSKDPDAKKQLDEARHEPLLAGVTLDTAVRKLLGLPPWAQLNARERLTEGDGRWSLLGDDCDRILTLHFLPPPAVKVRRQEQCKGKPPVDKSYDGTWKDDKTITVDVPTLELWPGEGTVQPKACAGKTAFTCFMLDMDPLIIGPFQRGLIIRPKKK